MIDTIYCWLAYLIALPIFTSKFIYFFTKRTWCVAFHRNQYIKTGGTKAYCDKCKWEVEPWDWE